MPASAARRLEWAPRALQAYVDSLAYIADQDARTAELARRSASYDYYLMTCRCERHAGC